MATQTIQFSFLTGQTVTVKLFADDGSDTVLATPTATEATNRTGVYTFTQTDRAAGNYLLTVSATGINAEYSLPLTLATATFWAVERSNVTHISGDSAAADNLEAAADGTGYNLGGGSIVAASVTGAVGSVGAGVTVTTNNDKTGYSLTTAPLDAAGVRAAVGLASANLDTQLGTLATASALSALVTTVGVAGVGLTEAGGTGDQFSAIPWNAAWDTEVQSECTDALNAYDPPTKAEQDAAFTDIKGAGWSSGTDTLEKIRDASGGGGGSTVQINPIAIHTGAPAEAPLMTCHQGEYGNKAYLFYDIDEYGQRSATDFSSYTDLRIGVALPDGTVWIETADITVSANQLTIPIGDLTGDVGTFDATLWDWAGAGATDQRLVVACMQLVVTDAVGADEVVA